MLNFVPHGGNGVSFQRIVGWEVAIVNKAWFLEHNAQTKNVPFFSFSFWSTDGYWKVKNNEICHEQVLKVV
jgi:hypothetical protein